MRISDWSSDVCSSDLSSLSPSPAPRPPLPPSTSSARSARPATPSPAPDRSRPSAPATSSDRKNVVEGKRVAVRVDLGGRRHIKNNHSHRTISELPEILNPYTTTYNKSTTHKHS